MKRKFSRALMGEYCAQRLTELYDEWGFDANDGTEQLRGASMNRILAYGEVQALNRLCDDYELPSPAATWFPTECPNHGVGPCHCERSIPGHWEAA